MLLELAFVGGLFMQGFTTSPVVQTNVTVTAPPMDPVAVREAGVETAGGVMSMYVAPAPVQWANDLLGLPDIYRTTPPNLTYANPGIASLAELLRNASLALLALFIIGRALGVMLGRDAPESLGRPFFAALLAIGNQTFWRIGIDLNNAITASVGAPDLPSLIRPHLTTTIDPTAAASTVILLVVYAIVAVLLMFSQLFRLGLIDVLIAVGSLLLLCKATQETEHIASHYTRIAVATVFAQVILVICFRAASVMATLGGSGVLGMFISIAILWLARSAPQQIMAGATSGQGNRYGNIFVRAIARRVSR